VPPLLRFSDGILNADPGQGEHAPRTAPLLRGPKHTGTRTADKYSDAGGRGRVREPPPDSELLQRPRTTSLVSFLVSFSYVLRRSAHTTQHGRSRSRTLLDYAGPRRADLESMLAAAAKPPETKIGSPARFRPPISAVITNVRRIGSSRRRSISGWTLALGAAACRYWSCAGSAAELRMLRPGPRPGIPGRAYLQLRVHLVPGLRGERPARRLSELRRRARPAPHPPGAPARSRPAIDQPGCPARMRSGIRPLIRLYRRAGTDPHRESPGTGVSWHHGAVMAAGKPERGGHVHDRGVSDEEASRQSGVRTSNSLPSGSARHVHGTSPWPRSMSVAPRARSRATSAA
jgi:hypothetical protein